MHFNSFAKKSWRPFFSRRPHRPSKYTSISKPLSKNCPKHWLLLWLGVYFVSCGGALTYFSCKLSLKFFFTALEGAGAPTAPPVYAYDERRAQQMLTTSVSFASRVCTRHRLHAHGYSMFEQVMHAGRARNRSGCSAAAARVRLPRQTRVNRTRYSTRPQFRCAPTHMLLFVDLFHVLNSQTRPTLQWTATADWSDRLCAVVPQNKSGLCMAVTRNLLRTPGCVFIPSLESLLCLPFFSFPLLSFPRLFLPPRREVAPQIQQKVRC